MVSLIEITHGPELLIALVRKHERNIEISVGHEIFNRISGEEKVTIPSLCTLDHDPNQCPPGLLL